MGIRSRLEVEIEHGQTAIDNTIKPHTYLQILIELGLLDRTYESTNISLILASLDNLINDPEFQNFEKSVDLLDQLATLEQIATYDPDENPVERQKRLQREGAYQLAKSIRDQFAKLESNS